jgi:hypothetical protein
MNIVKNIEQYNEDCVYFCEPIKNNIMNTGNFIRIIYSNSLFTLNGIYLILNINFTSVDKYYNKYKFTFDCNTHKEVIENIRNIEEGLLKKIYISNKTQQLKIYEQIKHGIIKVFSNNEKISNHFLLKIAGIWETDTEYGLTYKITNI